MRIFVTGGAGYIGSHCVLDLLEAGHEVTSFDNHSNSSPLSLSRAAELAGRAARSLEGDVRDREALRRALGTGHFDAVIHFAGLKAVGESVEKPMLYVENNIVGSANLLAAMKEAGCRKLVFSSSCTVYGMPEKNPLDEAHPRRALNPYGRSKLVIEDMCLDLAAAEPGWRIALLRYFNPVGAHESGRIGEDPRGMPNNLMPILMQTAAGRRPQVSVWGSDYPTPDGTGVRDYIHILDLVGAHRRAVERIDSFSGAEALNLGTGRGYSVLEMLAAASKAVGKPIPYAFAARRPGDAPAVWADPSRAAAKLGWKAELGLERMVEDHWRWQKLNPEGYR